MYYLNLSLRIMINQLIVTHKKVHGRKSKVSEYGNPEFNIDSLRG
jgi:hypothetical protein